MSQLACPNCSNIVFPSDTICPRCNTPLARSINNAGRPGIVLDDGYVLPPPPQVSSSPHAVWREKSTLVMSKHASLPKRCIKCNDPTERRVKRTLTWHHPLLYLLIIAGLLVYVIVAMVLRQTAVIEFGVCDEHYSRWRRDILITVLLIIGGIVSIIAAIAFEEATLALVGGLLFLGGIIFGIVRVRLLLPTKIDKEFVWIKGVNKDYLDTLPQWTGPR